LDKKNKALLVLILNLFFLTSCVSHLKQSKSFYSRGGELEREYKMEMAYSAYQRAYEKACVLVKNRPSAQAYMMKGLSEIELEMWDEAEKSFLKAFDYGFEKGEEWAQNISLFSLALSMEEFGLEQPAAEIYDYLLSKSKLKPVSMLSVEKYSEFVIQNAFKAEKKEQTKMLEKLLKKVNKLTEKDLSCGYYHYIESQVLSHMEHYRRSFEQAVMARELGLPTLEVFRDNDNQIVFCFRRLKNKLTGKEWKEFESIYNEWIQKWGWEGLESPDWKRS
jgi:tetratricopeptide (TPR) repeat protein